MGLGDYGFEGLGGIGGLRDWGIGALGHWGIRGLGIGAVFDNFGPILSILEFFFRPYFTVLTVFDCL